MPLTTEVMAASGVRFGTSGARGLVSEMSDEVCFAYVLAFLHAVGLTPGTGVALGIDLRPSSPRIATACAAAIRAAGGEVVYCGAIPTPALAFYAQTQAMPAMMVTGSHIPFDRNGIKFYRAEGEISKADEATIVAARLPMPEGLDLAPLPMAAPEAWLAYVGRYLDFFPAACLAGMRLGFYEHSSLARDLLTEVLVALGAEVISLERTDAFVPIDTEAVGQEDVARAQAWAAEGHFDALISTDGDADRPLIGDEQGRWLRGDVVGILCARFLGATAVVTPVSSNTALEKCGAFSRTSRTRIGSPYVIAGMAELVAAGETGVVGFEANGGFLVGTPVVRAGRVLAPLPTRDAVLPILVLLAEARMRGVPVSALPHDLPARFTASGRLQHYATERSQALVARLARAPAEQAALFGDLCGGPAAQDETDGLRMTFSSGEVVHLRPSGNAPELRCYAEADSQARADDLVLRCLDRIAVG